MNGVGPVLIILRKHWTIHSESLFYQIWIKNNCKYFLKYAEIFFFSIVVFLKNLNSPNIIACARWFKKKFSDFAFFCLHRKKYCFRQNFWFSVFDGFSRFGIPEHDLSISGKGLSVCLHVCVREKFCGKCSLRTNS